MNNILKSVVGNTLSQTIARIVSSATGFFIAFFIARSFGVLGYSDIAKITALVTLFYLAIDLGANAIFLQFEQSKQKLQDLLSFRFLLAGIMFVVVVIIATLLPYDSASTSGYSPLVKEGIILFALSFFSRSVVFSTAAIFQKKLQYHLSAVATITGSIITLVIVVFTSVNQWSVLWIIGAYLIGGFIEASFMLVFARQEIAFTLPSSAILKKIFFTTLPLTLLLFLNLLYFRADIIILSLFQKASSVGLYDYAYRFFDFLIALPLFLSNSLYPHLLRLEKNSRIQIKNISLYTTTFFFLGAILIPLAWFFAPFIAIVKQDFLPSVTAFRLLSFFLPIFFATSVLQWIFITKKKQTILVWIYTVSLILNIALNFLFIPHYSYIASAILTGVSEALILVAMVIYVALNKL